MLPGTLHPKKRTAWPGLVSVSAFHLNPSAQTTLISLRDSSHSPSGKTRLKMQLWGEEMDDPIFLRVSEFFFSIPYRPLWPQTLIAVLNPNSGAILLTCRNFLSNHTLVVSSDVLNLPPPHTHSSGPNTPAPVLNV